MRRMHDDPERPWTISELAGAAGMSRSAFFDRFTRAVGLRPMEYLLAWRMAVAKDLLRRDAIALDEVARRVGYSSASTFSTAFSRHVGQPPGRYVRMTGARSALGAGSVHDVIIKKRELVRQALPFPARRTRRLRLAAARPRFVFSRSLRRGSPAHQRIRCRQSARS